MPQRNDEPVLVDELERWDLVREIGDELATCVPPHVYGVHGDWGLGKTSVMHQVQFYLTGQCPTYADADVAAAKEKHTDAGVHKAQLVVVWFEAWRYQHEPAPVVALLHELRSQLAWLVKAKGVATKTLTVAARTAVMSLDSITKLIGYQLPFSVSTIQQQGERWERENLAEMLPSNVLRDQLEAAIDGLLEPILGRKTKGETNAKHRVIVMIDDLDRCNPAGAYRLLEGLKIYLTLPNCVFLLGMNQRIMEDAIGQHVPINEKSSAADDLRAERAAAYLEKLCQNVWRLPPVVDPKKYLMDLIPDDLNGKPRPEKLHKWLDTALGETLCLPPNPRRLKGLANLLGRFERRLPEWTRDVKNFQKAPREVRRMLIVAYVYQFHHDLFRLWQSDRSVLDHLLTWCRTPDRPLESEQSPLAKVLRRLHRVKLISPSMTGSGNTFQAEPAFPDPIDTSVFWMQQLLHQSVLEDEWDGIPAPAIAASFQRYLLGVPGAEEEKT